jgi:hypothetical protein
MAQVWTKKCNGDCDGFVADEQELCDFCLAAKYKLYDHLIINDCSDHYPDAVDFDHVIAVIRELTETPERDPFPPYNAFPPYNDI